MKQFFREYTPYLALVQAVVAMFGSLMFSEVFHFTPCVLCWYQRICMYPLVAIIFVGIFRKNKELPWYVFPLSLVGEAIAIYHNLLYYGVIPERIAPCTNSVPCTTHFFAWFGFITIPLLSLTAFTIINILMFVYWKLNRATFQPAAKKQKTSR